MSDRSASSIRERRAGWVSRSPQRRIGIGQKLVGRCSDHVDGFCSVRSIPRRRSLTLPGFGWPRPATSDLLIVKEKSLFQTLRRATARLPLVLGFIQNSSTKRCHAYIANTHMRASDASPWIRGARQPYPRCGKGVKVQKSQNHWKNFNCDPPGRHQPRPISRLNP